MRGMVHLGMVDRRMWDALEHRREYLNKRSIRQKTPGKYKVAISRRIRHGMMFEWFAGTWTA